MAQVIEDKLLKALAARIATITSPLTPRVLVGAVTQTSVEQMQDGDVLLHAVDVNRIEAAGSGTHHWSMTVAIVARTVLVAETVNVTPLDRVLELGAALRGVLYADATQSAIQAVTAGSARATELVRAARMYYVPKPGRGEGGFALAVTSAELKWIE